VPEVVADGETGWLVATPEPAPFAAALTTALSDPAELRRRGDAARARAAKLFDAHGWADSLAGCYRAVAAGRTVGRL
jgi:starch synthase